MRSAATLAVCRVLARPSVDRARCFSTKHIDAFRSVLRDEAGVVTDSDTLASYNRDWTGVYTGRSQCVLRPRLVDEVSKLLSYCNQYGISVVPQGGNTGLVGGGVPKNDEVILSMSRMNRVLSFDDASGVLVAEAGCVLASLEDHCANHGWTMPLDLGAKGSCMIGGNISTNAGGLRLVRYGPLHGSVLGVQAVLADGTVINELSTNRKDNTGYSLKHLFIGSEGTLGVVTAVSLQTARAPKATNVCLFGIDSFDALVSILQQVRSDLGEIVSALEFFDRGSLDLVLQHVRGSSDPFTNPAPFYLLVETRGSNEDHDLAKLEGVLGRLVESPSVIDGTVADSSSKATALWSIRESITESLRLHGRVYKYDVSLPLQQMYDLVQKVRVRLSTRSPEAVVVGYGHLGDGNLHLNIGVPHGSPGEEAVYGLLEPYVYEEVAKVSGSISAEHGLGQMKNNLIHHSKSLESVALMRTLKQSLDPHGILNPGKVLPDLTQS